MHFRLMTKSDFDYLLAVVDGWWGGGIGDKRTGYRSCAVRAVLRHSCGTRMLIAQGHHHARQSGSSSLSPAYGFPPRRGMHI